MANIRLHRKRSRNSHTTTEKQQIPWARWHPRRNVQKPHHMDQETATKYTKQNKEPRQPTPRMDTRNTSTHI